MIPNLRRASKILAQQFKDTLNLFFAIKEQKIDLIPFLNALNEAEVLNYACKDSIISLLKVKMTA